MACSPWPKSIKPVAQPAAILVPQELSSRLAVLMTSMEAIKPGERLTRHRPMNLVAISGFIHHNWLTKHPLAIVPWSQATLFLCASLRWMRSVPSWGRSAIKAARSLERLWNLLWIFMKPIKRSPGRTL